MAPTGHIHAKENFAATTTPDGRCYSSTGGQEIVINKNFEVVRPDLFHSVSKTCLILPKTCLLHSHSSLFAN